MFDAEFEAKPCQPRKVRLQDDEAGFTAIVQAGDEAILTERGKQTPSLAACDSDHGHRCLVGEYPSAGQGRNRCRRQRIEQFQKQGNVNGSQGKTSICWGELIMICGTPLYWPTSPVTQTVLSS